MAYDEIPRKPIEVREGRVRGYKDHDALIEGAGDSGHCGDRTDAGSDDVGFLGIDDLDRIRRKMLKHQTR